MPFPTLAESGCLEKGRTRWGGNPLQIKVRERGVGYVKGAEEQLPKIEQYEEFKFYIFNGSSDILGMFPCSTQGTGDSVLVILYQTG